MAGRNFASAVKTLGHNYVGNSRGSAVAGVQRDRHQVPAASTMNDRRWKDDPGIKEWKAFAAARLAATDFKDVAAFYGVSEEGNGGRITLTPMQLRRNVML